MIADFFIGRAGQYALLKRLVQIVWGKHATRRVAEINRRASAMHARL